MKITPKVQYSFNLTNPSWNAWFSLPTATFSSDRSYLTDMQMGQWVQPMPDDARPYVVRTVYVFQWAIFDSSGRIAGWTAPYRIAEDYSTYSIFVGTTPTLGEGCVIF